MKGKYFNNNFNQKQNLLLQAKKQKQLTDASYKAFMLVGIMSLIDEFEFTEEQVDRFINRFVFLMHQYDEGRLSIKDIEDTIKEEVGVEIRYTI